MLDVECQCGTRFKLDDQWAGKQVKCPACGAVFTIAPPRAVQPVPRPAPMALTPVPVAPPLAASLPAASAMRPPPAQSLRPIVDARAQTVAGRFQNAGAVKWVAVAAVAIVLVVSGGLFASRLGHRKQQPVAAGVAPSQEQDATVSPTRGSQTAAEVPVAVALNTAASAEPPIKNLSENSSVGRPARPSGAKDGLEGRPTNSLASPDANPTGEPAIERAAAPATRPRTRRTKPSGELSGVSRNYDDLHCQLIQSRHGARVPAAATIIEVDGDRLPIANPSALALSRAPVVFLPRGQHAVRFRGNESLIATSIAGDLLVEYWAMRDFFDAGGQVREGELLSRSARALDSHSAPMLLNLMGAAQAGKGQWAAAERKFRRSLRVNPCFSPAHLNLAHCLQHRGAKGEAARELRLAAIFNVGNVFGLAAPIHALAGKLELSSDSGQPVVFDPGWYLAGDAGSLTEEDRRITALLVALSKYAQLDTERAKILNNLGAHFADLGRAELALDHFRSALAVLKQAGPERFALAREVLTHMSDACRTAGLEEAEEYERMRVLVSP